VAFFKEYVTDHQPALVVGREGMYWFFYQYFRVTAGSTKSFVELDTGLGLSFRVSLPCEIYYILVDGFIFLSFFSYCTYFIFLVIIFTTLKWPPGYFVVW